MMTGSQYNVDVPAVPTKPLYQIKKRGKLKLQVRGTYDQARAEARKLIRVDIKKGRSSGDIGLFDNVSRNPGKLGHYRIVRVNG